MAASILCMPESLRESAAPTVVSLRNTSFEDRAVEAQVLDSLSQSPYAPLRSVTCRYREGVLTLKGHLATYHLKQLAQVAVMRLGLVGIVLNNRIEVDR